MDAPPSMMFLTVSVDFYLPNFSDLQLSLLYNSWKRSSAWTALGNFIWRKVHQLMGFYQCYSELHPQSSPGECSISRRKWATQFDFLKFSISLEDLNLIWIWKTAPLEAKCQGTQVLVERMTERDGCRVGLRWSRGRKRKQMKCWMLSWCVWQHVSALCSLACWEEVLQFPFSRWGHGAMKMCRKAWDRAGWSLISNSHGSLVAIHM